MNSDAIKNIKNLPIKILFLHLFGSLLALFFLNTLTASSGVVYPDIQIYYGLFMVLFLVITVVILYFILNRNEQTIRLIENEYKYFKDADKNRFIPYEFALDNSVDAIHWLDSNGKIIYVNDATCKILGYEKDEFYNMHLEEIDPNFDRQGAIDIMREIQESKNWVLETTHKRKDGTIFPVEVTAHGFSHYGKKYVCAFARNITRRIENRDKINKINNELQKSLEEKEILLKEIHHRVKNNMEIISSLLNMQARRAGDEKNKKALLESMSRIQTMALVHEFLYLGKSLAEVNFPEYISRLIENIKELYITNNTKLEIDLHLDSLTLSTDQCIQLGMVIHEICVNSMKYAFKEDKDNLLCIHIKLEDNLVKIKIRDNGEGIQDIASFYKSESIGMQLIRTIVENQLDGKLNFHNNRGLECNIEFSKEDNTYE
jgi:PAS domain S-box-containing protein